MQLPARPQGGDDQPQRRPDAEDRERDDHQHHQHRVAPRVQVRRLRLERVPDRRELRDEQAPGQHEQGPDAKRRRDQDLPPAPVGEDARDAVRLHERGEPRATDEHEAGERRIRVAREQGFEERREEQPPGPQSEPPDHDDPADDVGHGPESHAPRRARTAGAAR